MDNTDSDEKYTLVQRDVTNETLYIELTSYFYSVSIFPLSSIFSVLDILYIM